MVKLLCTPVSDTYPALHSKEDGWRVLSVVRDCTVLVMSDSSYSIYI